MLLPDFLEAGPRGKLLIIKKNVLKSNQEFTLQASSRYMLNFIEILMNSYPNMMSASVQIEVAVAPTEGSLVTNTTYGTIFSSNFYFEAKFNESDNLQFRFPVNII